MTKNNLVEKKGNIPIKSNVIKKKTKKKTLTGLANMNRKRLKKKPY